MIINDAAKIEIACFITEFVLPNYRFSEAEFAIVRNCYGSSEKRPSFKQVFRFACASTLWLRQSAEVLKLPATAQMRQSRENTEWFFRA